MRVSAPVPPLLGEILSSARTLFPVPFKIRPDKPQLDISRWTLGLYRIVVLMKINIRVGEFSFPSDRYTKNNNSLCKLV